MILRELLFADDCAVIAYTEEDLQSILKLSQISYQIWSHYKYQKTEVMCQIPAQTSSPSHDPVIHRRRTAKGCTEILLSGWIPLVRRPTDRQTDRRFNNI